MHGTSGDTGAAHDAGIHIVELWIAMVSHLHLSSHACTCRPTADTNQGCTSLIFSQNDAISTTKSLITGKLTERRNCDVPVPFKFFAEGGAAGQFLAAVDCHRAGATNCRSAGIAKCQTPIAFVFDTNERVEDGHSTADIEPDLLRMGCGIDFGIESLNCESETHRLVLNYEC